MQYYLKLVHLWTEIKLQRLQINPVSILSTPDHWLISLFFQFTSFAVTTDSNNIVKSFPSFKMDV